MLGNDEKDYVKDLSRVKAMSGRTYHKMLKVARTIADMDESEDIKIKHLAEASGLRGAEEALFGLKASERFSFQSL